MIVYLDASILVALFTRDQLSDRADAELARFDEKMAASAQLLGARIAAAC